MCSVSIGTWMHLLTKRGTFHTHSCTACEIKNADPHTAIARKGRDRLIFFTSSDTKQKSLPTDTSPATGRSVMQPATSTAVHMGQWQMGVKRRWNVDQKRKLEDKRIPFSLRQHESYTRSPETEPEASRHGGLAPRVLNLGYK